jgi:hypothetical protein
VGHANQFRVGISRLSMIFSRKNARGVQSRLFYFILFFFPSVLAVSFGVKSKVYKSLRVLDRGIDEMYCALRSLLDHNSAPAPFRGATRWTGQVFGVDFSGSSGSESIRVEAGRKRKQGGVLDENFFPASLFRAAAPCTNVSYKYRRVVLQVATVSLHVLHVFLSTSLGTAEEWTGSSVTPMGP